MKMTMLARSLVLAIGLLMALGWAPPTSAAEAQATTQTPSVVRVSVARASIYDRAATNGAVVVAVVRGDQLDVLGTSGTFYRVRTRVGNRTGFIAMSAVERVPAGPAATPAAPAGRGATPPPPQGGRGTPPPTPAGRGAPPPTQGGRGAPPTGRGAVPPRPAPEPAVHIRGFVGFDRLSAAASDTFNALAGKSAFTGFTLGADVYGRVLPANSFVRLGFSSTTLEGERVVVADNDVFSTGIALTMTMKPVTVGGGIRFVPKPRPSARRSSTQLTPYVGLGVVMLKYREVSDFGEDAENAVESHTGVSFFGGVDLKFSKLLSAGVEAEYRSVKGFGSGGVSEAFGEDKLGGLSLKFLIGVTK